MTLSLRRRSVLAGLAAAPVIHRARAADAIEQRDIEIAAVHDPQVGVQMAVADAKGLFKAEGLNVTLHWTQSGADMLTFLGSGSQYLGTGGSFNQVLMSAHNLPVKLIAGLADMAGTQGIALSPGVKLASPREMEGKSFAYTQGTPQILILAWLAKRYGFDQSKVKLVLMEPSEGLVAAGRGDVQGLMGWQPFLNRLVQMGGTLYINGKESFVTGQREALPDSDQPLYAYSTLQANEEWIRTRPNTLKAVLRALLKANDIINNDRPAAIAVMQKMLPIDAATLALIMQENRYSLAIDDTLAHTITSNSDWAVSIKRIPAGVTPAEAFAPELLRQVAPELVTWKG